MRATVAWWVKLPEVPVMVMVEMPITAVAEAVSVSVLLLVVLLGLKEAVTPFGTPEADRLTSALKPFCGVMVIVVEPLVPWVTVTLVGELERVKFCAETGQLLTRLEALTLPMPVAESHPVFVPYAGRNALWEVESTPTEPSAR